MKLPEAYIPDHPDGDYALRILQNYRAMCDYSCSDVLGAEPTNPLCIEMNRANELRKAELDKAIAALDGSQAKRIADLTKALKEALTDSIRLRRYLESEKIDHGDPRYSPKDEDDLDRHISAISWDIDRAKEKAIEQLQAKGLLGGEQP